MAHIDVFNADPFSMAELTGAVNKMPRVPTLIGDMGLFVPKSIRTEIASFDQKEGSIGLIQTSARGAPLSPRVRDSRTMRHISSPRIAKSDTLFASELANLRAFGSESELAVVQTEVSDRLSNLVADVNLTWENMRLGAVQGIVLDADGSTLYSLYDLFDVTQQTEVDFDLDNASPASGALRKKCSEMIRACRRAAGNGWVRGRTYLTGLCDDTFWDQLIAHTEVRATYLNQVAAAELRGEAASGVLDFGGIKFMHYDGTDDNTTVKVPTGTCKFFPTETAGDFWQAVLTPGEFFPTINQPGQALYALTIPDRDREAWVKMEVYSYPLFICTRPASLGRARNT